MLAAMCSRKRKQEMVGRTLRIGGIATALVALTMAGFVPTASANGKVTFASADYQTGPGDECTTGSPPSGYIWGCIRFGELPHTTDWQVEFNYPDCSISNACPSTSVYYTIVYSTSNLNRLVIHSIPASANGFCVYLRDTDTTILSSNLMYSDCF